MATFEEALDNAKENFHRWDDVVFQGEDGLPPLVNVELNASTVSMFLKETGFLKIFFAEDPKHPEKTNTNIATILYNGPKLMGLAVESGNKKIAYNRINLPNINELLEMNKTCSLPDWRHETEKHAHVMRSFIEEKTGVEVGLVKCADLNGFFGRMVGVFAREETLSMFLYAGRAAIDVVSKGALKIDPKPKFFDYLKLAAPVAPILTTKTLESLVWKALPDMKLGVVVQCSTGHACLEIKANKCRSPTGSQRNNLVVKDWTEDIGSYNCDTRFTKVGDVAERFRKEISADLAAGITMEYFTPLFQSILSLNTGGIAIPRYGKDIAVSYDGCILSSMKKAASHVSKEYARDFLEMPARRAVNKTFSFFSRK
ncbi:MAG: hypothetical protein ABIB71_01880 [Candidatus Woesearchaeota archaeon]